MQTLLTLAQQGVLFSPNTQHINKINYDFDNLKRNQLKEEFITAIKRYYPELDNSKLHPSYTGIDQSSAPPLQIMQ